MITSCSLRTPWYCVCSNNNNDNDNDNTNNSNNSDNNYNNNNLRAERSGRVPVTFNSLKQGKGIMCILCTPRPIYQSTSWSTYRPTLDRCIGRHIGRVSTDVLVDISVECWSICRPMYQPRYRPSDGQHIDRLSADISVNIAADTQPIRWPLIVGGISVDCQWYIGQKLRLLVYKLYAFHQKFLKASC